MTAQSLRICVVSRALPTHRLGGLEHHLRDLALALAVRGHTIHIVTTSRGAEDAIVREMPGSIKVIELPGTTPGDYSFCFFQSLRSALSDLNAGEKFDFIIPIEFAGLFLPRQIGNTPVVPLIHGTMTTETPLHPRYWRRLSLAEKMKMAWQFKARIALNRSFWRMVRRVPAIIVDSEFTRRELLSGMRCTSAASKIHEAALGIDLRRYPDVPVKRKTTLAQGPLRICLLGRVQKMKGIEVAIRAAAQLRLRGVSFHMSIGGSGDYQDTAAALVRSLQLEKEVALNGRIAAENLAVFFGEHDVFLFPDLTQPAFGLVAVEAMAYGLPVVAARSGAIPEVVTSQTGWLYDPWNISELAALLASIAKDRASIDGKAEAGRKQFNYYTSEAMAERTEAVLKSLSGEHNAARN